VREIVLDTETTGFKPEEGHRIVEIGCVELINHVATGRTFHRYINPERDMPNGAFEVHGLSEQFLADKPVFSAVADDFLAFVDAAPLVIHNAAFDMAFLNSELKTHGRPALPEEQAVDTLQIARRKHPTGPNSLDALCRRYGIDNSGRTKHGALLDAELLAEVYLELIGGRQPHLTLVEQHSTTTVMVTAHTVRRARPRPLEPRLSEDEDRRHRAFVETLGERALWRRFLG
jgi:DNA polymerase III subunit epsilon